MKYNIKTRDLTRDEKIDAVKTMKTAFNLNIDEITLVKFDEITTIFLHTTNAHAATWLKITYS
jgi:hypothetical protein